MHHKAREQKRSARSSAVYVTESIERCLGPCAPGNINYKRKEQWKTFRPPPSTPAIASHPRLAPARRRLRCAPVFVSTTVQGQHVFVGDEENSPAEEFRIRRIRDEHRTQDSGWRKAEGGRRKGCAGLGKTEEGDGGKKGGGQTLDWTSQLRRNSSTSTQFDVFRATLPR